MKWTKPSWEEIKMDSEIGSYQPDDERRLGRELGPQTGLPARKPAAEGAARGDRVARGEGG